jgi:hypothetical protein
MKIVEEFEDTKRVIRILKKNRPKAKNDLQKHTHKTKD